MLWTTSWELPLSSIRQCDSNQQSILQILEETRLEIKQIKEVLLQRNLLPLEEKIEENKVVLQSVKENVANIQEGCLAQMDKNHKVMEQQINNDREVGERLLRECNETLTEALERVKNTPAKLPRDCSEILKTGETLNGVYHIFPTGIRSGVSVYCDLQTDGGGWTVIIQRQEEFPPLDFARTFEEYARGFGRPDGEFWIGNRVLHAMTGSQPQILRVEATNLQGDSREATWATFSVGSEATQFELSAGGYLSNSTMGDGLMPPSSPRHHASGMKFSTTDRDNIHKCSKLGEGGWWYNHCYGINPTAPRAQVGIIKTLNYFFWSKTGETDYTGLSEIRFKIRPRE
ncbi:angiopoietin-4-like [Macrobrachium nipponense]|uniref:angiopoietin-4-like n=1 Tax=Macrobrachium nipponense TaxID=159736 RepID=UPI0030C81759